MKISRLHVVGSITVLLTGLTPLRAQAPESDGFSRLNSNVAMIVGVPLNPTSKYTATAWGLAYGAGYNFTRRQSLLGEFMWSRLSPTNTALAAVEQALPNSNLHGDGNLVALTVNYRLGSEGKMFGTYFITGAGMYYRNASLSQHITTGSSITCNQAWLWWGFTCSSGLVTSHQTIAGYSSTAPGGNVGIGFTVRIPDSQYKFYVESRFHYAANHFVATKVIPITVGIRF